MPYIENSVRELLIEDQESPQCPRELEFILTQICSDYLDLKGGVCHAGIIEIIGVLECVKQEFFRLIVSPYNEQSRFENGDVYGNPK